MQLTLLLLLALPVDASLQGAPVARPPFSEQADTSTHPLPADWISNRSRLRSLEVPAWATGTGAPGGLVCTLTAKSPAWYLQLWRAPQQPLIIDGGTQVYVPLRPNDSAQLLIKFNNAYGKSVFEEIFKGVVTLGLSTLSLIPDGIKWWDVSLKRAPLAFDGSWGRIDCRAVAAEDLTRWAEPVLSALATCTEWPCLEKANAMLGPWDERLLAHARRIQRRLLDEREARLASAMTSVRGMAVLDATVQCRATCAVAITWRNDTAFPMRTEALAQVLLDGLDADGQHLHGTFAKEQKGTVMPGETQVLSYPLQEKPAVGPIAFDARPEWGWKMAIPGTAMVEGTLISVGVPSCEAGKVTVPIDQRRVRGSSLSASGLFTADGVKHRPTNSPLQMDSPDCAVPTVLELKPDVVRVPIATR